MKKMFAAFGAAFVLLAAVLFAPVVKVHGSTTPTNLFSVAITGSDIESTTIGATSPSTGAFTSLNSSSIGATTPGTGVFSSLSSTSGALNGTIGASTLNTGAFSSLTSTSGALNGSIGASTPSTGAFTSFSASSATISGLTSGNCVQASTGGLLTTTSSPCPTMKQVQVASVTSGICPSPMANAAYASCSTAISWPVAFADANYAVTIGTGAASTCCLTAVWFTNKTTTGVTVWIQNGDASAANPLTVSEIDVHGSHP